VFRKDPTQSLAHLDSLAAVVANGRLYEYATLDRALENFSSYFRSPIVKPRAARGARHAMSRIVRRSS